MRLHANKTARNKIKAITVHENVNQKTTPFSQSSF